MGYKTWKANRKLKVQFNENRDEFRGLVQKFKDKVLSWPESESKKQATAQAAEWERLFVEAQLLRKSDLKGAVQQMELLRTQLLNWKSSTATTQTQTPVVISKAALVLDPLVLRIKLLSDQAGKLALATPDLLTQATQAGEDQIKLADTALPDKIKAAEKQILGVLEYEKEIEAFFSEWADTASAETLSQQALPSAAKLFDSLHSTWDTERQGIAKAWGLVKAGKAVPDLRSSLAKLEKKTQKERDRLLVVYQDAMQKLATRQDSHDTLFSVPAVDQVALAKVKQALVDVKADIEKATTEAELIDALKKLLTADTELKKLLTGSTGEALKEYQKCRQKLLEQLAAAKKLRGASITNSGVYQQVAAIETALTKAKNELASARTEPLVNVAVKTLKDALKEEPLKLALAASKKLKKEANSDLEALPNYQKALADLKEIRLKVSQITGAEQELDQLDTLIREASVGQDGRPNNGFKAALERIAKEKPNDILTAAQTAGQKFDEKLGNVVKGDLQKAMTDFEQCHTAFEVTLQKQLQAQKSRERKLDTFITDTKLAVITRKKSQTDLKNRLDKVNTRLNAIVTEGMLATDPGLLTMKEDARNLLEMLDSWRVVEAERGLQQLEALSDEIEKAYSLAKSNWQNGEQKLKDLDAQAMNYLADKDPQTNKYVESWGRVQGTANGIHDAIERINSELKTGVIDHRQAFERASHLLANSKSELDRFLLEGGIKDKKHFDEINTLRKKLEADWKNQQDVIRKKIKAVDGQLKSGGVVDGSLSMPWDQERLKLQKSWAVVLADFKVKPEDPSVTVWPDPVDKLQDEYDKLSKELTKLKDSIPEPTNINGVDAAVKSGKTNELMEKCRQSQETALNLLLEFKAAGGTDTELGSDEITLKADVLEGTATTQLQTFADLTKKYASKVKDKRTEIRRKKEPTIQAAIKLQKAVAERFLNRKSETFRNLFNELNLKLDDARKMLDSNDPDLIKAAERQVAEIELLLKQAQGKGGKGAATLEMVVKRHEQLSHLLGDKAFVQRRMPQTYARLRPQLDRAWTNGRSLPPDQGLAGLNLLQQPIAQARKTAEMLEPRYQGFKLKREAVRELLDQVKKHTGTTLLGGSADAYNERMGSRLSETRALARQEGKLDEALKALLDIEKELRDLLSKSPETARKDLLEENSKQEEAQRDLRDLARNWNATEDYWKDTLLPAVEKAVKDNEEGEDEFKSLKAAVLNIGRTLDPYLAVVSKLPHKRKGSNGAPDMGVAKQAFSQAYVRLNQLQKVAQRLLDGGSSTNVELVSDLNKLEQEWDQRTRAVAEGLAEVLLEIDNLPKDVVSGETDKGKDKYLPGDKKVELEKAVNAIKPELQTLASRFAPGAFKRPLDVLRDRQSQPDKRLKAREDALRTMRQMKIDVVDNPVFMSLYEGAKEQVLKYDLRKPIGLLRASLKKIELAVLVGI